MKTSLFLFFLLLITEAVYCQAGSAFLNKFNILMGDWIGEGTGKPGEGTGTFSFKPELDSKIIMRKSHSEYPQKDKSVLVHNDVMIIYNDQFENIRANYYDNEGHVINYSVDLPDSINVIFTSDKLTNMPVFKLTYTKISDIELNVKFDIAQDGKKFATYLEGKSKKEISTR